MNSYGPTPVGSYDYRLVAVSLPNATKLLQALECLCMEAVK
jgi:hypothetical protein